MSKGSSKDSARWQTKAFNLSRRKTILSMAAVVSSQLVSKVHAASCLLTPDSGEGPFYFDPALVRTNIRDKQPGAPLDLNIQIVRADDCAILENARVDIWHANAIGLYSGYTNQNGVGIGVESARGQQYLRGTQFTDDQGRVTFQTVYPSWYYGRTPHVHFKIFLNDKEVVASQIYFPDDVSDEVFTQWEPYRTHAQKRNVKNSNDRFLRYRVEGVFCEIKKGELKSRETGFDGKVVIAVS